SQPNDPFLLLIQKEPILLEDGVPVNRPIPSLPAAPVEQSAPIQAIPPASPLPLSPSGADWHASPEAPWAQKQGEPELPARQEPSAPAAQEEQPWYEHDQYAAASTVSAQNWENVPNASTDQPAWNAEAQEEAQPAQPDWLNTLTRNEQAQTPVSQAAPEIMPTHTEPTPVAQDDAAMPFFFSAENEESEGEMGWPAWLKSLGAESLEPEESSGPLAQSSPASAQPETYTSQSASGSGQPDWMHQLTTPVNEPAQPDWMNQFAANAQGQPYQQPTTPMPAPVAGQEQRYIASLEDLEKSLQSQGFAPLTPGSLSSIAQTQTNPSASVEPRESPSLSSALAQLGNFTQPPVAPPTDTGEQWWNTMLTQSSEQSAQAGPTMSDPFAALGAHSAQEATMPMPALPATPTPQTTAPFQPSADQIPVMNGMPLTPTYRSDALLDSDLETTMKRPAITLQPMKTAENHGERHAANGKWRGGERKHAEHLDESNLSHHERLIKGYQYQLSGAYEESMQEY
ncbi:MAG: hypothetical protein ACRDHW_09070, partial [Ktedonobacteraceae bacterium]